MNPRVLGGVLFVVAAGVAVAFTWWRGDFEDPLTGLIGKRAENIDASALVGGEKMGFLGNAAIKDRLADEFGVTLKARRAGSLEMVQDPALLALNPDFFWPSSAVAVEIAKSSGLKSLGEETVFNSPIVLYSWSPIADALEKAGIAKPLTPARVAWSVDIKALLAMIQAGTSWNDLGVGQVYGAVRLTTTDPRKSNSGNQAAGLMLQVLSGQKNTGPEFDKALDDLTTLYGSMGYLQASSGDLFQQYLNQGMGSTPIIAGYENQLVEFAQENPQAWEKVAAQPIKPVLLYPEPTVYSAHIIIAMTEAGLKVAEALKDPTLQGLAWTEHGFRTGLAGGNNPDDLTVKGLPAQVTKVIPMPPFKAVRALMTRLDQAGL